MRYLIFAGIHYYSVGGIHDLYMTTDDYVNDFVKHLELIPNPLEYRLTNSNGEITRFDWYQIYDTRYASYFTIALETFSCVT